MADIAIRGIGAVLLGACAASAGWLCRSVHRPPAHATSILELGAAALVVLCWTLGWSALGEGQGLFRSVELSGRFAHFDRIDKGVPS